MSGEGRCGLEVTPGLSCTRPKGDERCLEGHVHEDVEQDCAVCPVVELAATDPARAVFVGMTMGSATPREHGFDRTFKLCTRCRVGLLRVVDSHNAHFHGVRR